MEASKVIVGLSDIKYEFKAKSRTTKELHEIVLWFTFKDNLLCVHDYHDHNVSIAIALKDNIDKSWRIYLRSQSYGEKLVKFINGSTKLSKLEEKWNITFKEYGRYPIRSFF